MKARPIRSRSRIQVLTVACATLLCAIGVAAAAFPVLEGPAFVPGDLGVPGESIGNQEDVAVTAGGSGFLVTWTDMRTSYFNFQGNEQTGRDVYAARLDAGGALLDTTPIIVNRGVGSQQEPLVAWNGQNWLVIWEHEIASGTGGAAPKRIFAARISPEGTVLDDPPFEILETPGFAGSITQKAVVANGTDWLVVGQADSGGGILGVRVAADGTLLDPTPVVMAADSYVQYFDVDLEVAQGEYLLVFDGDYGWQAQRFTSDLTPRGSRINLPSSRARVASNGTEYFVTWDPIGGILRGSRMTLNGTLLDPGGIALMDSQYWDDDDSRVEWDGTNWWVFHQVPGLEPPGLYFVRVATDGTIVDPAPVFAADTTPASFFGPFQVAGSLSGGLQLVWADQDCSCPDEWGDGIMPWGIKGRFISADAQVASEGVLSCSAPAQIQPDLTPGPDGFLALYVSEVDDSQRVMARRLDPLGSPLDEQPIEIAASPYAENPEAAWNGSVYMITWDEFYYCVGGDWPPCGTFIHAVRMLPDGTVIDPEPIFVMQAWDGDVAALGDQFLVVGRYNPTHAHEVNPYAARVDGNTGDVLDPVPMQLGTYFTVRPRVTTFAGKWLVVWEQKATHDFTWGATRYNFVSADGDIKFTPLQTQVACGGGGPEVATSATSALVVCREGAWGHFLTDLNGGLIYPDETTGPGFEISGAVEEQRSPAVAFDGSDFIVVWEDQRNIEGYFDERTDLYGTRVSVTGSVLDPLGIEVATGIDPEQHPALASANGDTLLAASIFRPDPGFTSYRLGVFHAMGTVTDPPDAAFKGVPNDGCSPLTVDFVDQSLGNVTSWLWQFGDGTTSTDQNPRHVYSTPGVYSVTMTAAGSLGGVDTAARFGYVTSATPTQANFGVSMEQACAPLGTVQFTDLSDGFPDSWIWDFGDGNFSTEQHPNHTYQFPGLYTVSLTVSGSCGTDSRTVVDVVQVDPPCDQVRLAKSDIPVAGTLISGDYTSTWVYDIDDFELFYEDIFDDGSGLKSMLDHRWDFEVPAGDTVMFNANTNASETEGTDWFRFEYSTDGVTFTPLADIPVGFATIRTPMPSNVSGTVHIRLVDNDQTTLNYLHHISIDFLSIDTFVPMPDEPCGPVVDLTVDDAGMMSWAPATGATEYDVMRGSLASLHVNGSVGDADCMQAAHPATAWSDADVPAPGTGFYYIIRGQGTQRAPGTYDNPGPPPVGWEQRDLEVGTGGGLVCPDP